MSCRCVYFVCACCVCVCMCVLMPACLLDTHQKTPGACLCIAPCFALCAITHGTFHSTSRALFPLFYAVYYNARHLSQTPARALPPVLYYVPLRTAPFTATHAHCPLLCAVCYNAWHLSQMPASALPVFMRCVLQRPAPFSNACPLPPILRCVPYARHLQRHLSHNSRTYKLQPGSPHALSTPCTKHHFALPGRLQHHTQAQPWHTLFGHILFLAPDVSLHILTVCNVLFDMLQAMYICTYIWCLYTYK